MFLISGPDPTEVYVRFRNWAIAYGFELSGEPNRGTLEGTPVGMAGLVVGRIRGSYVVSGDLISLQLEEDLPPNEVSTKLSHFGLRLVRHS